MTDTDAGGGSSPGRPGPHEQPARGGSLDAPAPDDHPTGRLVPLSSRAAPADPGDAADRGSLSIDDVVVTKVAVAAAGSAQAVSGAARRVLGVSAFSDEHASAVRAHLKRLGAATAVTVRCSISYPTPVARAAAEVRDTVAERITALTGVRVTDVDVEVTSLHNPTREIRTIA